MNNIYNTIHINDSKYNNNNNKCREDRRDKRTKKTREGECKAINVNNIIIINRDTTVIRILWEDILNDTDIRIRTDKYNNNKKALALVYKVAIYIIKKVFIIYTLNKAK